jgi:hypothetical protein
MTDREENIQNMFISTVQFDAVNSNDYSSLTDAATNFAIVRTAISALETDSAAQISGARGRAVEQKSVLREATRRKMKRYSRTARSLNIDDPGFRRLFRIPDSDNDQSLLATAREFVAEARRFAVDFARLGIPANLADELGADIAAMDTAINTKASANTETVGASAGVDAQIERGMTAERILDSIMKNVYHDNPVKLAEWGSARHVKRSPKSREPIAPTS